MPKAQSANPSTISVASGSQSTGATGGHGTAYSGGVVLPGAPGYLTGAALVSHGVSQAPAFGVIIFGSDQGFTPGVFSPDQQILLSSGWVRGGSVFGLYDGLYWTGRLPLFQTASRIYALVDNETGAAGLYDLYWWVEVP